MSYWAANTFLILLLIFLHFCPMILTVVKHHTFRSVSIFSNIWSFTVIWNQLERRLDKKFLGFCVVLFLFGCFLEGGGCCGFCLFSAFIPEKAGKGIGTVSEGGCVAGQPLLALLICEGHTLCSTLVDDCSLLLSLFPVSVVSFCVLLLLDRNQTQSVFIFVLFAVWEP